jgi:hypothetical protein
MLTRKSLLLLIIPVVIFTQCTTWYRITRKDSKYYSPAEMIILADTTSAIDFKYGFEPDLELDYIYMAGSFSASELASKEKKLKDTLLKYKTEEVVLFYEKIYRLTEILIWHMNDFKEEEEWAEATLIEKYLLPDTKKFLEMLEKNVILIDVQYRTTFEERKRKIKQEVIDDLD